MARLRVLGLSRVLESMRILVWAGYDARWTWRQGRGIGVGGGHGLRDIHERDRAVLEEVRGDVVYVDCRPGDAAVERNPLNNDDDKNQQRPGSCKRRLGFGQENGSVP